MCLSLLYDHVKKKIESKQSSLPLKYCARKCGWGVPLYPEAFLMGSVHTFSEQTLDVIITRSTVSTFLQVGWVSIWASGEIILFPNFLYFLMYWKEYLRFS